MATSVVCAQNAGRIIIAVIIITTSFGQNISGDLMGDIGRVIIIMCIIMDIMIIVMDTIIDIIIIIIMDIKIIIMDTIIIIMDIMVIIIIMGLTITIMGIIITAIIEDKVLQSYLH